MTISSKFLFWSYEITLIRHGIAEEKKWDQSDFLRPLTPEWRSDFLERLHRHPNELQNIDIIICSPAVRCSQTCNLLCSLLDIDPDWIIYDNRIYTFEEQYDTLLHILQELPSNKQHVCLIGHNDSISALASHLIGEVIHIKKWKIIHTVLK